jgi:hypothetical protein
LNKLNEKIDLFAPQVFPQKEVLTGTSKFLIDALQYKKIQNKRFKCGYTWLA